MNGFDTVDNLAETSRFHLKRHGVLASNLANAETPNYRPKDLSFPRILAEEAGLQTTNAQHIGPQNARAEFEIVEGDVPPPTGDNNGVRLEETMAQLAANKIRFKASVELTRRQVAMMRYAATDGRSG